MITKLMKDFLILFTTVDPIGTLAVFVGLTASMDKTERRRVAKKTILYASTILIGSIFIGQGILSAMGVELRSLQVSGGVILFLFGLQMLFGSPEAGHIEKGHDIAVFPLAIPNLAGPGSIMAIILLTDHKSNSLAQQTTTAAVLLFVMFLTWVAFIGAHRIVGVIGKNGAAILVKVMGMLLAAFSVQMVFEAIGVRNWL